MAKIDTIVFDVHEIKNIKILRVSFLTFLHLLMRWRDGGTDLSSRHFDRAGRTWVGAARGILPEDCHLHFPALRPSTRNDNDIESGKRKDEIDAHRRKCKIMQILKFRNRLTSLRHKKFSLPAPSSTPSSPSGAGGL